MKYQKSEIRKEKNGEMGGELEKWMEVRKEGKWKEERKETLPRRGVEDE